MALSLTNFKTEIEGKILDRGRSIYLSGDILEVEQEDKEINAWVQGTEEYHIEILLDGDDIPWKNCSCPYDYGDVCKHVAAVLYHLSEEEEEEEEEEIKAQPIAKRRGRPKKPTKTTSAKKQPKKKTSKRRPAAKKVLEQIDPEQLREFLADAFKNDRSLKERFMAKFSHVWNEAGDSSYYRTMLRSMVTSHAGRYGFIDYRSANALGQEMDNLMDTAEKQITTDKPQALGLLCAIIEEVPELYISGIDDSSGYQGYAVERSFELLKLLSENCPEEMRENIFEFCIREGTKNKYEDYGSWWSNFITLMEPLVDDKERKEKMDKHLNTLLEKKDGFSRRYLEEDILKTRYKIESRFNPAAAEKIFQENLHIEAFRKTAFESALKNQDFKKAKKLAKEGSDLTNKNYKRPNDWDLLLYDVAQLEKDEKTARDIAEYFYYKSHHKKEHLPRLEKHIPKEEWNSWVDQELIRLEKQRWFDPHSCWLAVRESRWGKLKKYMTENPSFMLLKDYGDYLAQQFGNETVIPIYKTAIWALLKEKVNRSGYQKTCQRLKRLKPYMEKDAFMEFIREIKLKYPRRPALLSELRNNFGA